MRLKAIKDHRYAGTNFRMGEEYEATKGDAFVLVGAKLAVHASASAAPARDQIPKLETKEMLPAKPEKKQNNKKRKYGRRYI